MNIAEGFPENYKQAPSDNLCCPEWSAAISHREAKFARGYGLWSLSTSYASRLPGAAFWELCVCGWKDRIDPSTFVSNLFVLTLQTIRMALQIPTSRSVTSKPFRWCSRRNWGTTVCWITRKNCIWWRLNCVWRIVCTTWKFGMSGLRIRCNIFCTSTRCRRR